MCTYNSHRPIYDIESAALQIYILIKHLYMRTNPCSLHHCVMGSPRGCLDLFLHFFFFCARIHRTPKTPNERRASKVYWPMRRKTLNQFVDGFENWEWEWKRPWVWWEQMVVILSRLNARIARETNIFCFFFAFTYIVNIP